MPLLHDIYIKAVVAFLRLAAPAPPTPRPDEQLHIPSRDAGRTIRAHVYRSKAPRPSPVLVNFHGSGFVLPHHGSDDEFARYVALETDYTVLDIAYRLGPEHPFPAATDDVEDVFKWVLSQPEQFDASKISVSGFSAGGNLALGASVSSPNTIRHVIAIYPVTDLDTDPAAKQPPDAGGRPLPTWVANAFNDAYLPPGVDRKGPLASPSFIPGAQFPDSVLIITAAYDSLAHEAEALAAKIREIPGKHVVSERMEGCNHAWDKNTKPGSVQEEAKNKAYEMAVDILRG